MVAIAMKKCIVLFLFLFTSAPCFSEADTRANVLSLTCQQIRAFVDGHNSRRLLIAKGEVARQPPASDMKSMVWDEELAGKAAQWAKKNFHKHNPNKSIRSNRFLVGENLYWHSSNNPKFIIQPDSAMETWFGEHVNYTFGPLKMSDFQQEYNIGHYTQLAWSKSVYLGCAISETFKDGWKKFFVVCNYGPAGNYLGQTPYSESSRPSNKLIRNPKDKPYGPNCN